MEYIISAIIVGALLGLLFKRIHDARKDRKYGAGGESGGKTDDRRIP